MRYFESRTPTIKVFASGGEVVKWLTVDGLVGWYATDRPGTLKTLDLCIQRKVGGAIREGTQEEYEDFTKKVQGRPAFRRDREFLSPEGVAQMLNRHVSSGQPSSGNGAAAADGAAPPAQPVPVAAAPDPVLRRRGRPRRVEVVTT